MPFQAQLPFQDEETDRRSFLPRHLHYASIPATKNAPLLPRPSGAHPTILFSHGLGGSRNAYSYNAGSLASHGAVVLCPEHRDGSAVTSFIRNPEAKSKKKRSKIVPFRRISHDECPEMYARREGQLRIRLWELALIYEAMEMINAGKTLNNLNVSTRSLDNLKGALDLGPGKVVFAGHSFGSATMIQLLKSTYYAENPTLKSMKHPLFRPGDAKLRAQITSDSATILLDLWATPMCGPNSDPLFRLPMPCYDGPKGGSGILSISSEVFYDNTPHLLVIARLFSPDPSKEVITDGMYVRDGKRIAPAEFYLVNKSAHLNQSDFGVLFPFLTKKVGVTEPDRVVRLNVRAMLQHLRENGVPIGRTSKEDLVDGPEGMASDKSGGVDHDPGILKREGVRGWEYIDPVALFKDVPGGGAKEGLQETDMEAEMEPGVREVGVVEASPGSAGTGSESGSPGGSSSSETMTVDGEVADAENVGDKLGGEEVVMPRLDKVTV